MKKKIAVGLAAVALAAMPALGTFAVGESLTDTIVVTVSEVCTMSRGSTAHTNGDGTWGTGTTANTLSATMSVGTVSHNLGSSSWTVVCNHATGYAVTVATTALVHDTSSTITIPNNTTFSASVSGWAPKNGSTSSATKYTNGSTVKTSSTPVATTNFTTYYGAGVSSTQAAGTYTGTATYSMAAL